MSATEAKEDGPRSRNRIVAFVDILGASQMACSDQASTLVGSVFRLGRTMRWSHRILHSSSDGEIATQEFKPGIAQFSDCLLLWSDPLDGLEPDQFVRTAGSFLWNLCAELGRLLLADVPFRAGVSEGPVFIYPELNIYAGRPIVEAVRLEGAQDWLGAAMLFADRTDRLIKRPNQIYGAGGRSMFDHFVVPDTPVPLKANTTAQSSDHSILALNWALAAKESQGPSYQALKTKLQALQANADATAQGKYELAAHFLETVESISLSAPLHDARSM